jgi:hypothetical protein
MTFQLLGSHDNIKFDPVFSEDLYDYDRGYGEGGRIFHFIFDTARGRANGQRCGSCSTGPAFTCSLDAYDGTCDSRYCGQDGLCASEPQCPAGEYMHHGFNGYARPAFYCKQCAAGRYGATPGLRSAACSGLCAEGHFCPAGSTSATQFPCRGAGHYCPEGSPRPIPAAAGRFTVSRALDGNGTATTEQGDRSVRVAEELCPRGSYCRGGVVVPCPAGRYGNTTGLQTADCSAACGDGTYCPPGSVLPLDCPLGHYCPTGVAPVICPAGTFGAQSGNVDRVGITVKGVHQPNSVTFCNSGLRGAQCSGYCAEGHYCPAGSVSPTSVKCPAGTYGGVAGLRDAQCSGLCAAGYYCPKGSASARQVPCGGSAVYCPIGSALPVSVTKGTLAAL